MSNRDVVGPVFTAYGFKMWFWACCPTQIVTVPTGFWVMLRANSVAAHGGLVGGVLSGAMGAVGEKHGASMVTRVATEPEAELVNEKGCVVYKIGDLARIEVSGRRLTSPEIIITEKVGNRTVYGAAHQVDIDKVFSALQAQYGDLVQRIR